MHNNNVRLSITPNAMMTEERSEKTPLIETKDFGSASSLNYGSSNRKVSFDQKVEVGEKGFSETNLSHPTGKGSQKSSTISLGSDENLLKKISQVNVEFANFDRITLTWSDIRATAAAESKNICQPILNLFGQKKRHKPLGRKQILKNNTGVAYPGRLMALMGASGAGKTTLLNVLTQRNLGKLQVDGDIRVNGIDLGPAIRSISAYVQQDDLFFSTLKVKEHLYFQANLRLGKNVTKKEREERVSQVMLELGLNKCADTLIGGKFSKSLSGGEMKRLAFASEALTNPSLMFCDEPTSGLDSFMAQQVVGVLKEMARKGKTIICTIHQPSSQVFQLFDDLCLLAEGSVAYMGPLNGAVELFNKMNFPCPLNFNPADHYIRTLAIVPGKEQERKKRVKEFCRAYRDSDASEKIQNKAQGEDQADEDVDFEIIDDLSKYKASWFKQLQMLLWRSALQNLREPLLLQVRLWQAIVVSVIMGLVYFQTEVNSKTVQNINGILFSFVMNMTMSYMFSVIHVFCEEMPIYLREHFSHIYRADTYYIAKNISELPLYLILPAIFTIILYFMAGLSPDPKVFFICLGVNILTALVAVSLGYFISTLFIDLNMAMGVAPFFITPFMIVGGFFVNENTIPVYFIWLKYLSFMKYSYEALAINEWQTVDYIPGCGNFTCPVNGTAVLQTLNFDPNLFNLNILILIIMLVVIRFFGFLALLIRSYSQND